MDSPSQCFPPFAGAGFVQFRKRLRKPSSHVFEQRVHMDQVDQLPFTNKEKQREQSEFIVLAKRTRKKWQVAASLPCVETCVGWPNGLANFFASTRKSQKKKTFQGRHIPYFIDSANRLL